jgi:hypothetical protein
VPFPLLATVAVTCLARPLGYTHVVFTGPFEFYLIGHWGAFLHPAVQVYSGMALLAGVFILIVLLFVGSGQKLGACLRGLPALAAYSVNIAFSLLGGLVYSLLCWIGTGPPVWLTLAAVPCFPSHASCGKWRFWRATYPPDPSSKPSSTP